MELFCEAQITFMAICIYISLNVAVIASPFQLAVRKTDRSQEAKK
jgi:hypothetical protein